MVAIPPALLTITAPAPTLALSIPIPPATLTLTAGAGVRTLVHALPAALLTITAPALAQANTTSVPTAELTLTAPAPLTHQAVLLTTRWTFYDPVLDETWVMPINPDSEANPLRAKGLLFGRNARAGGRFVTIKQVPRPLEWTFGGVIRSQVHHDTLDEWAGRRRIIHVKDHMSRTFEVLLVSFEATERAPTKTNKWRMRYQMKALLLRQLS